MDTGLSAVSRYVLVTAAFVIVIAGMNHAAPLLIPFLLSIFIAILSVPLTISAKIALDENRETQWLGTLLGR